MKVFVCNGVLAIVSVASLIAYRRSESHRDAKIESTASANSSEAEWVPTEAELANRNQGVASWKLAPRVNSYLPLAQEPL